MKTIVVTRHIGALNWLKARGIVADLYLTHLNDIRDFDFGDVIIGVLPLPLIAKLTKKGVMYIHFSIEIPLEYRGMELNEALLEKLNPKLEQFEVTKV